MQNCVCTNWAPALTLRSNPAGSQSEAGSIGMSAAPRKKVAFPLTGWPCGNCARMSDAGGSIQEGKCTQIEDRFGVGLISGARIIAS